MERKVYPQVDEEGNKRWYNSEGKLHREDGPAVEDADGTKFWYRNGEFHREDGPAVEYSNGTKKWFRNGELHREDGPAVEYADGTKHWYLNGELHREGGPAVEHANGTKRWYLNGNLHREDGPAVEYANGDKYWYRNGKYHREDGPAVEYANGTKEWYLNDETLSEKEWKEKISKMNNPKVAAQQLASSCDLDSNGTKFWYNSEGKLHRKDGPAVEYADGSKLWYLNDKLHREDGPAVEHANGTKEWHRNGKLHREDGPAVEYANDTKRWYLNGNLHREDGPAIDHVDGTKKWYRNGNLHREDGPAEEDADGNKLWFRNGDLHREDGPAIERVDGTKRWYLNDNLHREDGPAVEYIDGTKEWWLNDEKLSEEEWKEKIYLYRKEVNEMNNSEDMTIKDNYPVDIENEGNPIPMRKKLSQGVSKSKNDLSSSIKHGLALGAATEGVNYTYELVASQLEQRFGISKETLDDPINKEIIMMMTVALLHLGSNIFEENIPNADKIQKGCSLIIEGKTKDNFGLLVRNLLPMLSMVGAMMDPDRALDNSLNKAMEEHKDLFKTSNRFEMDEAEMDKDHTDPNTNQCEFESNHEVEMTNDNSNLVRIA